MSEPTNVNEPITADWLLANGFRPADGHFLLQVGTWDLLVDVSPYEPARPDLFPADGLWFVAVHEEDKMVSIGVRPVRETWEIIKLCEGLTGLSWPAAKTKTSVQYPAQLTERASAQSDERLTAQPDLVVEQETYVERYKRRLAEQEADAHQALSDAWQRDAIRWAEEQARRQAKPGQPPSS